MLRQPILAALVAAFAAAAAPAPAAETAATPLDLAALRAAVGLREPRISPDGTRVVYVRSTGDYTANRNVTTLMLVPAAGGAPPRPLTRDLTGVNAPAWSPAGDRVAFLASPAAGKPAQIYVLRADGGDAVAVTKSKAGIVSFAWRPDGAAFAYAAPDDPPKAEPEGYVEAFTVTDEHFLTRTPSKPLHLWTIAADGTNSKQLTRGDASPDALGGASLVWAPDGTRLLVAMQPDAVFAHGAAARATWIDAASGTMTPFPADGPNGGPVISPDGTKVVLSTPRHGSVYLQRDAVVRDARDGHEIASTRGVDRNAHWFDVLASNDALLIGAADGVHNALWRVPFAGSPAKIASGDVDVNPDLSVARDGTIAFVGSAPDAANEIYAMPLGGGTPRRLTLENRALDAHRLARREAFGWTSDDGRTIDGVLTYPVDYVAGKRYPLVLQIHGGPVSTSTIGFSGTDATIAELLAARGMLVLQPNYRGSDGRGDAFLQAIVPHVTSGPGRDNLAGVAALRARGIVDDARIGVGGWSGGGLQTSWLVGHASLWKAAVTGAGVHDWYEQAVLADINEAFASDFLGGATPYTAAGRAIFREESPITYVDRISTPLLILSDTGDQRVPITQSFALYRALHDRGRTVSFVAFPRPGHFPADPVGRESVYRHWTGWFERWLK